MTKYHLWPEDPIEKDDIVELAATLEKSNTDLFRIWFRLPSASLSSLPRNLDPFVLAVLFSAMRAPADLEIHGAVSPSLLYNLEEFQKAWALWLPAKYHPAKFQVDMECERPRVENNETILAFSGGVDSAFTAWQHRLNQDNHHQKKLAAGVMVHGFDIPLTLPDVFARSAEKSRLMLDSIGVKLIPISTNLREQRCSWENSHGAALASCLMLFQEQFNSGLIASSYPYNDLSFPWGLNPITDRMLSTNSFQIIHHGAGSDRVEKIRTISHWPEARQYLRICWKGGNVDRNCCRCIKCVGAMLLFSLAGYDSIPAFPYELSIHEILHMKFNDLESMQRYIRLLSAENFRVSTLRTLKIAVSINRIRKFFDRFPVSKKLFGVFGNRWFFDPYLAGDRLLKNR
jgi:hypothetical protein